MFLSIAIIAIICTATWYCLTKVDTTPSTLTVEYNGEKSTYRCFKSWRKKTVPCEDKPGWCRAVEFGWDPVWVDIDTYLKTGDTNKYLNSDYIKEIEDCDEV